MGFIRPGENQCPMSVTSSAFETVLQHVESALVPLLAPCWRSATSGQKAVSKPMVRSGKARFVHFQDSQGEDSHSLRLYGGNTVNMCEQ